MGRGVQRNAGLDGMDLLRHPPGRGNHPQGPAAEPNSDLRAELEQAVSEERYEDAARLRYEAKRAARLARRESK